MKSQLFFYFGVLIAFNCCQQESNFPQGAWQMVQANWVYGDSIVNVYPAVARGKDIKIWSKNHYAYVGTFKFDTATSNFDHFGAGTYKLEGNRYEENLQFDYKKNAVGNTVKMLLELKNDTLYQSFPVTDNGEIDKDFHYVIKYMKLE